MSEQTLTVNGKTAGEKKTIALPSRPKKRLFIGMLLLVTVLAAALLYGTSACRGSSAFSRPCRGSSGGR